MLLIVALGVEREDAGSSDGRDEVLEDLRVLGGHPAGVLHFHEESRVRICSNELILDVADDLRDGDFGQRVGDVVPVQVSEEVLAVTPDPSTSDSGKSEWF